MTITRQPRRSPNCSAKIATPPVPCTTIVSPAVTQYDPGCLLNDASKGGLFNWLLDIDTEAKTLRTGGARGVDDISAGYCFLQADFSDLKVEPIQTDITYDETSGAFATTGSIERLTVPIFQTRNPDDVPILLPLRLASISDGTLSTDGNCIGRYRGESDELTPGDCTTTMNNAKSDENYRFIDGATIQGIISLEEADHVKIIDLSASLCTLLTGVSVKAANNYGTCPRNPDGTFTSSVLANGNASTVPAGSIDGVLFVATFAASSVTIQNGACP